MSTKKTDTKNKKNETTSKTTKKKLAGTNANEKKIAGQKKATVTKTNKKPVSKKSEPIKTKKPEINNDSNDFVRLIKIIIIITIIMAAIYIVTMVATKQADEVKDSKESTEETKEKTEIQYENIMIGTMLNKGGTYYVLIEESKDDDKRIEEYEQLITSIESSENAPTIYKANLTDSFNKVYKAKEDNYYVEDISDFKVSGTTLVKIENSKIVNAFDSYEEIKNELNNLK